MALDLPARDTSAISKATASFADAKGRRVAVVETRGVTPLAEPFGPKASAAHLIRPRHGNCITVAHGHDSICAWVGDAIADPLPTIRRHRRVDVTAHVIRRPPPPLPPPISAVSSALPCTSFALRFCAMEVAASSADGGLGLGAGVDAWAAASLAIDGGESPERRTARMVREVIRESPVVVVGRRGCFMCHVIRQLLAAVGAHPTVIEMEEGESPAADAAALPALFIGGESVGGIEGLIALHLGGRLVPLLREAGA
ncbi:uncharacterized protein LOC122044197 [Zingiber officinale]|uniref:Glutaredoxin domain-containing protein n=1 Tax=Zingiber officinale TaxID=94328 RepID=A0A8J5HS36_ZINOF|nr:uncharacterized protein LOC122044197 [Zingiber officinale]KAG6530063.1 hypothetical protein ZIOFF_012284 [Zingiber officinale]